MNPLDGIRVIALEQAVAGPLCTKHLADLGATVIKIERPGGGDFARDYDTVVLGQSAYFVWLNQGKTSLQLDIKTPNGLGKLEELLADADVLVHNLGPGAVERLGLGWAAVHERWPHLISCGISGFGSSGPQSGRKAFDLLLQAESGLTSITGTEESPARVGISIADISAGMYALSSVLAAIHLRSRTGVGTSIDISMLECLGEWLAAPLYHELHATAPRRSGMQHNMIAPYGPYRTGDGEVMIAVQSAPHWERFCETVLGAPDLAEAPQFATNELRVKNRAELNRRIESVLQGLTTSEVRTLMESVDLPSAPMSTLRDLAEHEQLAARDRWTIVNTPEGPVHSLLPPFNIGGTTPVNRAVPPLGDG